MIELNKDNFDAEVREVQGPVLVDFWSPKCDPCMALLPSVEQLAVELEGKVKFCKVNALENRRLCIKEKVLGLPTIQIYNHGEKVVELTKDDATEANIRAELAKF
ncbi:Thioredoxin [bioreactor metagenome]|uniref:Thioredoxin n=1 Tax=bioreactor metagenome TaxID=1076179 RepID=A0A644Z2U8_9ZZZZ